MEQKTKITIFDASTGQLIERDATEDERNEHELSTQEAQAVLDSLQAKGEARQSALAKLAKLGLTQDEIEAL